jgi:protein O-GlcNAc transferase
VQDAATLNGAASAGLEPLERAVALDPTSPIAHFSLGKGWHERKQFGKAAACYEKAIMLKADFAAAYCNLGLAYQSLGRLEDAVSNCRRALTIEPLSAVAHNALGLALQGLGKPEEAAASYRRAVEIKPDYVEALSNLGVVAGDRNHHLEAVAWFRKAIELRAELPQLHYNLGCALTGLSRADEAVAEFEMAVKLYPGYWEAFSMAGLALQVRGQFDAALACCERAIQLKPDAAAAHHRLGVVLRESGRASDAIAAFERAIALKPGYADALNDMAMVYQGLGQLDRAVAIGRQAIDADPGMPQAHCALGIALAELGRVDEAIAAIKRAIQLKPDYEAAHSAYLFHLNYSTRHDPLAVFNEHKRWANARADGLERYALRPDINRSAARRLRIGYVSPDFRQHSVAFFLTPVLARHDHRSFEVFCYSDVRRPDAVTRQLRGYADAWRDIAGFTDEQVAAQVRQDRIDILVDLAVHSGGNRLLVFARKPAPVQATWLGYAGTTGLATMDYKITDPHLDPVGQTENWHTERLRRLPDCYFCYTPPAGFPAVSVLPANDRGFITFCAFQNLAKVSLQAIELWSQVMVAVPASRLILKARGLSGKATPQWLRSAFDSRGVGAHRLQFEDWGDMTEYLTRFSKVDIALDTVPFNGGTTTFHALWMGVPLVTLAGESALGRMGASILQNLGLPELIAGSPGDYVKVAARLASDPERLAELRLSLRERMQRSPLTDAPRFTANLESAYRAMWIRWCASGQ